MSPFDRQIAKRDAALHALMADEVPVTEIPLRVVCAWHADFNPADPANAGASHGMCAECRAKFEAEWQA